MNTLRVFFVYPVQLGALQVTAGNAQGQGN